MRRLLFRICHLTAYLSRWISYRFPPGILQCVPGWSCFAILQDFPWSSLARYRMVQYHWRHLTVSYLAAPLLKCIQLLTCLLLTKVFCFWPWLKMRSAYHTKEVGRCWRCSRRIWVATAFRQQDPAVLWTLAVNPQGVFLLGCWLE